MYVKFLRPLVPCSSGKLCSIGSMTSAAIAGFGKRRAVRDFVRSEEAQREDDVDLLIGERPVERGVHAGDASSLRRTACPAAARAGSPRRARFALRAR